MQFATYGFYAEIRILEILFYNLSRIFRQNYIIIYLLFLDQRTDELTVIHQPVIQFFSCT